MVAAPHFLGRSFNSQVAAMIASGVTQNSK